MTPQSFHPREEMTPSDTPLIIIGLLSRLHDIMFVTVSYNTIQSLSDSLKFALTVISIFYLDLPRQQKNSMFLCVFPRLGHIEAAPTAHVLDHTLVYQCAHTQGINCIYITMLSIASELDTERELRRNRDCKSDAV